MNSMADRLIEAMTKSAARQYGKERVTELAHALQCAELAAGAGGDEEMVLACLLHDVGRYAVAQEEISDTLEAGAPRATKARRHHEAGADLIAPYVPERVTFLVRAHADAPELEGRHGHAISGSRHGQSNVEVNAVETSDEALHHAVRLADHAPLRVEDLDEQADVRGAGGAGVVDIAFEDGGALPTLARLPFHAKLGFRLRRRVGLGRGSARAAHEHEGHRRGHAETSREHW